MYLLQNIFYIVAVSTLWLAFIIALEVSTFFGLQQQLFTIFCTGLPDLLIKTCIS